MRRNSICKTDRSRNLQHVHPANEVLCNLLSNVNHSVLKTLCGPRARDLIMTLEPRSRTLQRYLLVKAAAMKSPHPAITLLFNQIQIDSLIPCDARHEMKLQMPIFERNGRTSRVVREIALLTEDHLRSLLLIHSHVKVFPLLLHARERPAI